MGKYCKFIGQLDVTVSLCTNQCSVIRGNGTGTGVGDAPHGTEYFTVRFDSNESVRRGGHVKLSRLFISEKCIGHPSSEE